MIINGTMKCPRCGNYGMLLSNGYCPRCDNVLFGARKNNEKNKKDIKKIA